MNFGVKSINEFYAEVIQANYLEREPIGKRLNFYFAEQVERQLEDFYANANPDLFKVAMVNFVYKNQQLLKLLAQRGDALKYHNQLELKRLNKLITVKVTKQLTLLTLPVRAYVTFERAEAARIIVKN